MRAIFLFISILIAGVSCSQTTGTQIGNFILVNKCHVATDGTKTDFYTLFSTQVGKAPKKVNDYLVSSGATYTVPGTGSVIGGACIQNEIVCMEEYIIDGSQVGNSTPSVNMTSTPIIGNQVIITSPFRSIAWNWMPGTEADPGDGSVAAVTVNGFDYYPTETGWNIDGYGVSGAKDQIINSDFSIVAAGQAVVKVTVIKTNCQ